MGNKITMMERGMQRRTELLLGKDNLEKRAEVRSFPYCYLYNIGKRPTS